jgi:outer membrane protein assembly factor BamB
MIRLRSVCLVCVGIAGLAAAAGADWPEFRGAAGASTSADQNLPESWSDREAVAWRTKLPGQGASSPIIFGDRIYVTCYSGYGVDRDNPGTTDELVRQIVCLNESDGKVVWSKELKTKSPEARYSGFMTQHGYASNTPATDGKQVFVFLGTGGVYAFDVQGNEQWHADVGKGTDGWGSACSLRLYGDLVIVNATIESRSVIALHQATGKEAWRFKVAGGKSWSTPALVHTSQGSDELIVNSEGRVSALDPSTGKEIWWCEGIGDYTCPSVLPGKDVVYVSGGRQSQMLAIRTGGKGDVSKSHVLWRERIGANVTSPVLLGNRLYGVSDRGIAYAVDAESGKIIYQQRLSEPAQPAVRPAAFQQPGRKKGFGGGGFGGGGLQFYASLVAADNKLYAVSRSAGTFVLAPGDALKVISTNRIGSDSSNFDATPAIADGKIYLRSNDALYCIGGK